MEERVKGRGKWQGMWTIARLNWPFYLAATAVFFGALGGILWLDEPMLRVGSGLAFSGAAYFIFVSLGVSHLIYDCSDLYRWDWLSRACPGFPPSHVIFCHSGFDESSEALRVVWPDAGWLVLDHFDEVRMSEPSIRRARALFPPTSGTLRAPFNRWPAAEQSTILILGLLAIHELRSEQERSAWFFEARRCLAKHGRVVLVEHLRDLANFLAFGPGFLHFHSTSSWRGCWEAAGMRLVEDFRLTPWVKVFVLERL